MADIFTKQKRSDIMSKVHNKGNKTTEMRLIQIFRKHKIIGWSRNYNVKGHPDFVFRSKKLAIFVDGCFWHGHNCRNVNPVSNNEYWSKKREKNIKHDHEVTLYFLKRGWTVLRIWECELKKKNEERVVSKICEKLKECEHENS